MADLPADPARTPWQGEGASRRSYRRRLYDLDHRLVAIADDIAAAAVPANTALLRGDRHAAAGARQRDAAVRARLAALEHDCFVTIAREAPVASDLRELVAIVRAVADLGRASKLLVHVVETLDIVDMTTLPADLQAALEALAASSRRILGAAVRAWRDRDGLAVTELDALDDSVDRLQAILLAELRSGQHGGAQVAALALLGRYYERLADHGVALAGHISWAVTGIAEGPWAS